MVLATASVKSPLAFQCLASASLIPVWANAGNASAIRVNTFVFMISASGYIVGETAPVERPFRLQRRRPCRRSSKNAGTNTGMAGETPTLHRRGESVFDRDHVHGETGVHAGEAFEQNQRSGGSGEEFGAQLAHLCGEGIEQWVVVGEG